MHAHATRPTLSCLVGASQTITALRHRVATVAVGDGPVLLAGERGTGKHLISEVLHDISNRSARPFVEALLTSPDAPLRIADGGTVFLGDIRDLPLAAWTDWLHQSRTRDVRLIAATTGAPPPAVADACAVVSVPSLRTYLEDVPVLVERFIERFNLELHRRVLGASTRAYTALQRYRWPGNVRELRNAVERAMLLSEASQLDVDDFAAVVERPTGDRCLLPAEGLQFEDLERLVVQALERTRGNQTRAGALLGMNRDQIRYRVEKFGLALRGAGHDHVAT